MSSKCFVCYAFAIARVYLSKKRRTYGFEGNMVMLYMSSQNHKELPTVVNELPVQ